MIMKLDLVELGGKLAHYHGDNSHNEAIELSILSSHWRRIGCPTALFVDTELFVFGWGGEHDAENAAAVLQDRQR